MKILLIGHKRHGKDTLAEMLNEEYGITYYGSSLRASEIFIFDKLKGKYDYETPEECFEDRVNHRKEWMDLIEEYNQYIPHRLVSEILEDSDMYVGLRSIREFKSSLEYNLFDLVIGVYDSRKPTESINSMELCPFRDSDIILANNGNLQDLREKVRLLNLK